MEGFGEGIGVACSSGLLLFLLFSSRATPTGQLIVKPALQFAGPSLERGRLALSVIAGKAT